MLSQDAEAERVQRPPGDVLRGEPDGGTEPGGDLFRRPVGEGDGADPVGWEGALLEEMSHPADETVGLTGAGAGYDEDGTERGLDRVALPGSHTQE